MNYSLSALESESFDRHVSVFSSLKDAVAVSVAITIEVYTVFHTAGPRELKVGVP